MKLVDITKAFQNARKYTKDINETDCLNAIQKLKLSNYKDIPSIPLNKVKELFVQLLGDGFHLDDTKFKEVQDFLSNCTLKKMVDERLLAKVLRYLLRKDSTKKVALLIVDVQNDFISGSLALKHSPACEDGVDVVPVINQMVQMKFHFFVYTMDWHPQDHISFITNVSRYDLHPTSKVPIAKDAKTFDLVTFAGDGDPFDQVLWPAHCIQGTEGAELHPELIEIKADNSMRLLKGTDPKVDSYSAFWDNNHTHQTKLFSELVDRDITDIVVCGLATDICVKFTAIDGQKHGFNTTVVLDACRGVAHEGIETARCEQQACGIKIIVSSEVSSLLA
eukprot:TCONS_00001804-protein